VLDRNYTEKCDIWSCGVILYILLSGFPPFRGSRQEILQKIKLGDYSLDDKFWQEEISEDAKKLLSRMMEVDHTKRCSAQEALDDPWFKTVMEKQKLDKKKAKSTLGRLQSFQVIERNMNNNGFIHHHSINLKFKKFFGFSLHLS